MANKKPSRRKRQRQKKEKERIQRQLVRTQKYTEKEVKNKSYNDLISISEKESKRQKRKDYRDSLRDRKKAKLKDLGYAEHDFSNNQIDKIRITDLQSGSFNRENYPKIFKTDRFDFDKVYKLKNDEVLYIAFRDFAGETSLEEILEQYSKLTNNQLIDRLVELNNMSPTYSPSEYKTSKKKGSSYSGGDSSGAAGDYKFLCGKKSAAVEKMMEDNEITRRMDYGYKRKAHGEQNYKGYQILQPSPFNYYFQEVTPRNILIVTDAIMANVTEWDRVNFYNRIYKDLIMRHMKDFAKILPYPNK